MKLTDEDYAVIIVALQHMASTFAEAESLASLGVADPGFRVRADRAQELSDKFLKEAESIVRFGEALEHVHKSTNREHVAKHPSTDDACNC